MQATADALDLNPPAGGGWRLPVGWALGVHLLLVLALTWGVGWQRDTVVVAEAELWSALPQVAAPRALEPETTAPEPDTEPTPPRPSPQEAAAAAAAAQAQRQADIAIARQREQERQKQLQLEREKAAKEKAAKDKAAKEKAAKAEKERQDKEAKAKADKAKAEQAAKDKTAKDKAAKEQAAKQEAQLEAERRKNIERMLGQAGAQGAAGSRGTAAQSSGPSASYAGRLVARIRPNIVFTDLVSGNPRAEVEVRALPDGTIVGSRLLKSSGHPAWDDAVLRAVERTAKLPQDENGRVPGTLILGFRPQD